jgi:hypothetical protein
MPARLASIALAPRTVTLKEPDDVLPCASVDEHETVVVPTANVEPEAGLHVTAVEPSTMSVADAENATAAPAGLVASTVLFDGSVNTGAVVSETVMSNEPDDVLPCASVDEHVTVVVPTANVEPETLLHVTAAEPSTMSVADAENATAAPAGLVASAVLLDGSVNSGAVVSETITSNVACDALPVASLAVHVTSVSPIGNALPEAGAHETVGDASVSSVTVGVS